MSRSLVCGVRKGLEDAPRAASLGVMQGSIQRARFASSSASPAFGGGLQGSRNPSGFGYGTRFCHAMFTRHERTL
jgi:hypothetical protein